MRALLVLALFSLLAPVGTVQKSKTLGLQVLRTNVARQSGLRLRVVNGTDASVSYQVHLETRSAHGWVLVDTDVLTPDTRVGMIRPLGAHQTVETPDLQQAIAPHCSVGARARFRLVAHYGRFHRALPKTAYSAAFTCRD